MIGDSTRFTVILLISSLLFACAVKSPRPGAGTTPSLKIQDIRVAEGADKTIVEIEGEGLMLFTSFQLSDPDRLILEISEVDLGKYRNEITLSDGPIRSITPIPMDNIFVSRLEFELAGNVKADVRPEGLNIVVEVTQLEADMGMELAASASKGAPPMGEQKPGMKDAGVEAGGSSLSAGADPPLGALPPPLGSSVPSPPQADGDMIPPGKAEAPKTQTDIAELAPPAPLKKTAPAGPAKKITGVRLVEGAPLIVLVELDGLPAAQVFFTDAKKRRIVVDFPGVNQSAAQANMPGDGRLVERIRTGRHPDKTRLVLDLVRPVEYSWEQGAGEFKMTLKADPTMQGFKTGAK